jgi:four helix bundle protein
MQKNLISDLTFNFSLSIIDLYQKLKAQNEYVISKQLLRSSTSIGANVVEALDASSKRDFMYKMSISKREASETLYWLKLLEKSSLTKIHLEQYLADIQSIIKILRSIIKTTSERLDKRNS